MRRRGDRKPDALRSVDIAANYLDFAEGSALIAWGKTRVLCAASVLEQVPPFKQHSGEGWVTAEYAMLPRSTHTRQLREGLAGQPRGRFSILPCFRALKAMMPTFLSDLPTRIA